MWKHAVLVLWAGAILAEGTDDVRDVDITQGRVRGHKLPEGEVYAFYNIPYATAPSGTNKFKAPLDPPVWTYTFDAVDRGIVCPQPGQFLNMQEDCLVANVFVPDIVETNLPVLVYVHGGAYQYSFGNAASLTTLVRTKKLIVVSFNYRLGAHGFLCLGTEGAPGNAGLKDQVALLRWVKTNIASFGGNPNDVTLFGCSAGSGSINFLTLSGITTGLFKGAIMDSGVATGAVGAQIDPIANAQNYAKLLNFNDVHDLKALEEFYKTASIEILYSQHGAISGNENSMILFAPCVERDVGQERVLAEAPINIIKQGNYNKVPLLYGFANMEGLMRIGYFQSWKDKMNEKFANFLPGELYFETEEDKEKVANTVKAFYFGDKPVSEENVMAYIDYFTDILFGYPMLMALKARVESLNDTIYLYEYSFVDEHSPNIPHTDEKGSNHCDQTSAVTDGDKSNVTSEYIQMKAIMRQYWLNFIWNGSPWVEGSTLVPWPPANANRSPHMSLGPTVQLRDILLKDRITLWDGIYEIYYRGPKPPAGSAALPTISKHLVACVIMLFYSFM